MSAALALALDQISPGLRGSHSHGTVIDQIEGIITVYKDGHVERPTIVPCVEVGSFGGVVSHDMVIDKHSNIWVRIYVPIGGPTKVPLVVYFHGGGFCVGSAAWSCYHHFLSKLCVKAKVVILSVNYRLAPENPLPAAYEDGFQTLRWIKHTTSNTNTWWWTERCDFSSVFLAGDSAGANITYYLACNLEATALRPLELKGTILIQPFFGGEARMDSERNTEDARLSLLSLEAADTYWRLALPAGADREHPWCNPLKGCGNMKGLKLRRATMVCVSENDILRDRNLKFCERFAESGGVVEQFVYMDVGHSFQILGKTEIAKTRAEKMISDIQLFISSH